MKVLDVKYGITQTINQWNIYTVSIAGYYLPLVFQPLYININQLQSVFISLDYDNEK